MFFACLALPIHAYEVTGDGASVADANIESISTTAFGAALDAEHLDAMRGGDTRIQVVTDLDGDVAGNSAREVTTGSNTIGGDAFANSAGISTVIQNSGANVLIQHGTAVNVQFSDPTP